jgi:hypothetical protein
MRNKVIILILSTNDPRYINFINSCTDSWVKNARKNGIRCIFYSGGGANCSLNNDNLILDCDDSLLGTALKLYKALEYIENAGIEYTHIYRTNLSSFLYINDFIDFSNSIDEEYYGGVLGRFNQITVLNKFHFLSIFSSIVLPFQVTKYASGSGFFISKNFVKKVLKSTHLNFKLVDDVMIGSALKGVNISEIFRFDYKTQLSANYNENCFHVRLKSSNRVKDSKFMYKLNAYNCLTDFINDNCGGNKKFN